MSDQLWVVRAGREARFVAEFLEQQHIAIAFREFASEDLHSVGEEALRSRVRTAAERSYAGQLIAFAFRMDIGDIVVMPRLTAEHRDYVVGRVLGPYEHVTRSVEDQVFGSGNHRRAVEWIGTVERSQLTPAAASSLGAISTLFRPAAAEAELRALLTSLTRFQDREAAARQELALDAKRTRSSAELESSARAAAKPHNPAQLDIEIDSQGRARINSAHPALIMEQVARHIEPGRAWSGVPGIYILTGTELQHSAVRTGVERTLTTTLIVRPWAYVGLSEDFLGRIGSHRQSKPEWRRALLVRSGGQPFASDDIKYLEQRVHSTLQETEEVVLAQSTPRGNLSAQPRNTVLLDACAATIVAVLRLTGTLI